MDSLIIFGAKYLIAVLVLIAAIYFFRQSREKQKQMAIFAIIALPLIYIAAKTLSFFYYNPRPFVVGNFAPLVEHIADNGFPSDHMLLSAAIAAIIYFYNKKVGVIIFALALLVGTARVLAGVHHALDIFGSLVIAIVVSFLVYKFILPAVLGSKFYRKVR